MLHGDESEIDGGRNVMKTVGKVAHFLAWTFAYLQIAVLLSTCLSGFSELKLGLVIVSQIAFFGFLFLSKLAEESPIAVRSGLGNG